MFHTKNVCSTFMIMYFQVLFARPTALVKEEIRQRRAQWASRKRDDETDESMDIDDKEEVKLYWCKDCFWSTGLKPRSSLLVELKKMPGQNQLGSLFSQFFSH